MIKLDIIFKIAAVGIVGTILAVTVKEHKKEFSIFTGMATGILIFWMLFDSLMQIKNLFVEMTAAAGIGNEYVLIMIKVIIVAFICEFAVKFCADAGENATGAKIELAGRVLILATSLPVMEGLFKMILNLSF